jgi:hypothetical protein
LVIVGHGLGAAYAAVLGLLLRDDEGIPFDPVVFGYGPSPIASPSLANAMKAFAFFAVNGEDLLPRLSYGTVESIAKTLLTLQEIDSTEDFKTRHVLSTFAKGESEDNEGILGMYRRTTGFPQDLLVPGLIYQIRLDEFVENEDFGEIVLSKTMLTDNLPQIYEAKLVTLGSR